MVNIKYVFKISFTHGSCCHTGHYTYPSKKFHSTSLNAVNCQHHRLSLHIQEKSGGEVELHSLFWSVYFDLPSLEWERWEHKQWLVFSSCKLLFQKHSANTSKNCWWKNILVTARIGVRYISKSQVPSTSLFSYFSYDFCNLKFLSENGNCHTITILILNMILLWCSKAPNTLHETVLVLSGSQLKLNEEQPWKVTQKTRAWIRIQLT